MRDIRVKLAPPVERVEGGGGKGNKQLASILLTTGGRGEREGCLFGEVGGREGKGGSLG